MIKKNTETIFYHLSLDYLGEDILLEPRIPIHGYIESEGTIPRICVSPNLFKCVRSSIGGGRTICVGDILYSGARTKILPFQEPGEWLSLNPEFKNPAVYSTTEVPLIPPKHGDFRASEEHWFISPVRFKFRGFLDINRLIESDLVYTCVQTCSANPNLLERFKDKIHTRRKHALQPSLL
jgi:hypothetical protein